MQDSTTSRTSRRLPSGIVLEKELRGHSAFVTKAAWSPNGRLIASASGDKDIRIWDFDNGNSFVLAGHATFVSSLAWSPDGRRLVSGSHDGMIAIWDISSSYLVRNIHNKGGHVFSLAWSPNGTLIASGASDKLICLWDSKTGSLVRSLKGHSGIITDLLWSEDGGCLFSSASDHRVMKWSSETGHEQLKFTGHTKPVISLALSRKTHLITGCYDLLIRVFEIDSGRLVHTIEGPTQPIEAIAASDSSRLLAAREKGGCIRLWRTDTWMQVAEWTEPTGKIASPALAFSPNLPVLAAVGENASNIHLWHLSLTQLFSDAALKTSILHATIKIVLLGDSGVGKTGLGWRLAHGRFKEHPSTHGQQFWHMDQLKHVRFDGTECEAVLWDFAGQPDYRLIHSLFLDDAELALVLFNPTDRQDPFHGVEFWLKALNFRKGKQCRSVLVGARIDRGDCTVSPEELISFCTNHKISGNYVGTSAITGEGIELLMETIRDQISWESITATTTTLTFKKLKEYILHLKESHLSDIALLSMGELREVVHGFDAKWEFSDDELLTAISHLAKYGFLRTLRTAAGEHKVLLSPDLLNNLAASFVIEARRNPKGLGALNERLLLDDNSYFPELHRLSADSRSTLVGSVIILFIQHNICFRETHGPDTLLIFPELINRKKPLDDAKPTIDGHSYTVRGSVGNVYAALVVLLGYTNVFSRTHQWQNQAQYQLSNDEFCGFKLVSEKDGEIELVLYFNRRAAEDRGSTEEGLVTGISAEHVAAGRLLFQGLFERILSGRDVTVVRYPPLDCRKCGYRQTRDEVVKRTSEGRGFLCCSECGDKIPLAKSGEPISLSANDRILVEQQEALAIKRTSFETTLVQLEAFVRTTFLPTPTCFISYAWDTLSEGRLVESWVEKQLATDLQKAGIGVVLDKWENYSIGSSVSRFISRIAECDKILVVGNLNYFNKYHNNLSKQGNVVAAEWDLISQRLTSSENAKKTVLPLLLEAEELHSFPPLLRGRVYADLRKDDMYFEVLFDLILSLYDVPQNNSAVSDLREGLRAQSQSNGG